MERTENKVVSVVESATVNVNESCVSEHLPVEVENWEESSAVKILKNNEKETEERIAKSPLHLSLRESKEKPNTYAPNFGFRNSNLDFSKWR